MNKVPGHLPPGGTSPTIIWRLAAIVLAALLLLGWLYQQAERVSPQGHADYSRVLRSLRENNTRVDAELLASHIELSRNYDALTFYSDRLAGFTQQVFQFPAFLGDVDSGQLSSVVQQLNTLVDKKEQFVDLFKRDNAILRNSASYFQEYADQVLGIGLSSDIQQALEHYVRHILIFARTLDTEQLDQIEQLYAGLKNIPEVEQQTGEMLDNLLLHGELIVRYQQRIDRVLRDVLKLQTGDTIDRVEETYLQGYHNARALARNYRNLVYLTVILLAAYVIYSFFQLERTRRSLARAHIETLDHLRAQQRAEKMLHLHDTAFNSAHEGITLTDQTGRVLEVNPAFSRITGYTREEVIGKNPRVLKSGRHDNEFYRRMWKSITETGNWRGEIWNRNKFGEVYPEILSITAVRDANGETSNFVAVFSDITRMKAQEEKLEKMAHFDALTGLPNRVLLVDRINQARLRSEREKNMIAICFMDLDGFKEINDTYGHEKGDEMLVKLSSRFREALRSSDTVSRLGGDEFVFLLAGLGSHSQVEQSLSRLQIAASQPVELSGTTVAVSASIGVTLYPDDKTDAESLLRHADLAMYQAKKQGKNCYHVFDPTLDSHERRKNESISEISDALQKNQMRLYYQPKVDARAGRVVGLEALIRWQHPERGLLLPAEFLSLVEDHEVGLRLGDWVLDNALEQLNRWSGQGLELKVSINVTGYQLEQPAFVQNLKSRLAAYPAVDPACVELEVLETAALEDIVTVSRVIEQCAEIGVSFALDDFGTGYSSLTYLKRLPAATLKIDLSFVREMNCDPENLAIVHAIMGLATAFQRKVIAEGVETHSHGRILLQLGCSVMQGYGISRPMPADEVYDWSKNWQLPQAWQVIRHLYWDDNDYPMISAEVEHMRWVDIVVHAVQQQQPIPHQFVSDHTVCRFGYWYAGHGFARYGHFQPLFAALGEKHEDVHKIAEKIDWLMRNGAYDEANALIAPLYRLRDEIIELLNELMMKVAHQEKPGLA